MNLTVNELRATRISGEADDALNRAREAQRAAFELAGSFFSQGADVDAYAVRDYARGELEKAVADARIACRRAHQNLADARSAVAAAHRDEDLSISRVR